MKTQCERSPSTIGCAFFDSLGGSEPPQRSAQVLGRVPNVLAPHADAPELPTCCAPNRQGSTESTEWGTRRWLPQSGCTKSFMSPVERASQSLPLRRIGSLATTGCPARPIFGYLLLRHARLPRHAWFCHRSKRLQNTGIGGRYAGSAGLAGCELQRSLCKTRQVLISCVRRIATVHSSQSRPSRSIVPASYTFSASPAAQ
jgi:hypothetical protein